jgi:para-nitrobenzyl esterase
MVGANSADIGLLPARTLEELYGLFGPDAAEARTLYRGADLPAPRLISAAGADQAMVEPARKVAQLLSARGQPVYEFRFSYVAQSLRSTTPGAAHASEIPYVFDTVATRYGHDLTAADEAAARAVHAYWVAFARSGRPDAPGLPVWPAYDNGKDQLMNFTQAGPVAGSDPWKARLDLAQRVNERKGRDADAAH